MSPHEPTAAEQIRIGRKTVRLGPYTIGSEEGYTPGFDLGEHAIGIITEFAYVVSEYENDEPTHENPLVALNFDASLDGESWLSEKNSPNRPECLGAGSMAFFVEPEEDRASLPGEAKGNGLAPRFLRVHHEAVGFGEGASATFYVDLTYF